MKNKLLLTKVLTLAVVALICVVTGQEYIAQQQPDAMYMDNPNMTDVLKFSDYNPNLIGTVAGDTEIYVFDSGVPGGKALVYGGTHPNELGSLYSPILFMENVKCEQGILYVIVRANESAYTHTQPLLSQDNMQEFILADGSTRTFRTGTRISNPIHQWPDPNYHLNTSKRELVQDEIAEIRNYNRNHPGVEDGYLTEMANYALYNFIKTEEIDLILDGHEAGAESTLLVHALVSHEDALPVASSATFNALMAGYDFRVENSGQSSYGLSHRGLGDNTDTLATLFETPNPAMGVYHEKVNDDLTKHGLSANYTEIYQSGAITNPFTSYTFDENGWPVETRSAYQMFMAELVLEALSATYPDKAVVVSGLPDPDYIIENGLEAVLKPVS